MKQFFKRPGVCLWTGVLIMLVIFSMSHEYTASWSSFSLLILRVTIMTGAWMLLYRALYLAEKKGREKEIGRVFNIGWHRGMGKNIHTLLIFNAACNAGKKGILWHPDGKVLTPALREEEIEGALQIVADYGRKLDEIKGGFYYSFFASARDSGRREAAKHIFDELKKFYTAKK